MSRRVVTNIDQFWAGRWIYGDCQHGDAGNANARAQEKPASEARQSERQKERVDAPVTGAESMTSDSTHGGNSASNSVQNSPNSSPNGSKAGASNQGSQAGSGDGRGQESGGNLDLSDLFNADSRETAEEEQQQNPQKSTSNCREHEFEVETPDFDRAGARKVREALLRLIEDIAEDVIDEIAGTQKLSLRELVYRRVTGRRVDECFVNEIHDNVVMLLDDSGSMTDVIDAVYSVAAAVHRLPGVKCFWAPNGSIERRLEGAKVTDRDLEFIDRSQVVIYFGDFDGADTPIEMAYQAHTVLWFCNEDRYAAVEEHDWCSFTENDVWKLEKQGLLKRVFFHDFDGLVKEIRALKRRK